MRHLIRAILTICLLAGPFVRPSAAVSVEDLLNLKANGLGDDVLVALISTDGSSFHLSAADVIALYKRGLSEAVILAMVATGQRTAEPPAPPPAPSVTPRPTAPEVATPIVVNVQQHVTQHVETIPTPVIIPIPVAVPVAVPVKVPQPDPVYWGFGGRLRPDAWRPAVPPDTPNQPVTNKPR